MKILIFKGGRGGEHDVSLRSAAAIEQAIEQLGHEPLAITLQRDGSLSAGDGRLSWASAIEMIEAFSPDAAFIGMHGEDGEDGRIQGLLDLLSIPYQGSGVEASAIGMNKITTKTLFRTHALPTAPSGVIRRRDPWDASTLAQSYGLPLVLKTPASGSSVGVEIVADLPTLERRLEALLSEHPEILAETFIVGREFSTPVVEDAAGQPEAFPAIEIRPPEDGFFDYAAKYTPGASEEICPAPIPAEWESELRRLAIAAHQAIGCRGYSRTDAIITETGDIFLLEINTLPGMTEQSLLPKSAAVYGLSFPQLIDRLLQSIPTSKPPG